MISLPAPGLVTVVVVDPAAITGTCLIAAEQAQAARFVFEKDAVRWRACRSALRRILASLLDLEAAAVPLTFGDSGKPLLAPPFDSLHFNLSHCHDLALVALCGDGPVGIDLEPVDRAPSLLGCESVFCHPREIAALPVVPAARAAALLDLWTAKEALLKAIGTGMSLAPQSVSLAPPVENLSADPRLETFRRHRLAHPSLGGHVACLAAPATVDRIEITAFGG